jgi:hypothetical protein
MAKQRERTEMMVVQVPDETIKPHHPWPHTSSLTRLAASFIPLAGQGGGERAA